jgi:hypothetical protein
MLQKECYITTNLFIERKEWYHQCSIGRFPFVSTCAVAELVLVAEELELVVVVVSQLLESMCEADESFSSSVVKGVRLRGSLLLYLEPGTPGLVGSSMWLGGFFDNINTTRPIVGRSCESPCMHSRLTRMHVSTCSVTVTEDTTVGSTISTHLPFLYSLYACKTIENKLRTKESDWDHLSFQSIFCSQLELSI